MQVNRLDVPLFGSTIDRSRPLTFTFDGHKLSGFEGDTLASALLAHDIHLVARSIRFHRPRGILSCGLEEPSALVTCTDTHGNPFPNLKATEVLLTQGLAVKSQNNWPSRHVDLSGMLVWGSRLLQAGFYYKTFKWPGWGWHRLYEKVIRQFAGSGRIRAGDMGSIKQSVEADQRHKFCQILVIGSGPAGLNAALVCARQGAQVIVVEQDRQLGGCLLWRKQNHDNLIVDNWLSETIKTLTQYPNVTVLSSTVAFGQYDHGLVLACETRSGGRARVIWKIRAKRILLASGAIEKPLIFPNNDRPGIMLAGAVREYLHRYAVRPGKRAFLAIADDEEARMTIADLDATGIEIAGSLEAGQRIVNTRGRHRISSVSVKTVQNNVVHYACDLICMSGGWTPTVHLAAHVRNDLSFDRQTGATTAPEQNGCLLALGASRGIFNLDLIRKDSEFQASQALSQLGFKPPPANLQPTVRHPSITGTTCRERPGRAFVDFQNDVTRADIIQTVDEGYRDIELVKRYTTIGMGTDQGKTSWANATDQISACTGEPPSRLGHTTFRPPYSPIPIAALTGARTGIHLTPLRRTPFHQAFEKLGCVFQTSGDWLYARYFAKENETLAQAVAREVRAVREGVGFVDMSTLGKIDVKGRDAEAFLSRIYCNNILNMAIGKARYGLMLREDGIVFDDGTIARLAARHYVITTTTANAAAVWRWMTKLAQTQWPDMEVILTSVSEHWASIAIAGPRSRELMHRLGLGITVDKTAFPFASVQEGMFQEKERCRVFSVSYSGELCFEVNLPAGYAVSFVERIMDIGQPLGVTPYGLETLDVLRIEKGHLSVGSEINGRTTPYDLGLGKLVSTTRDFIGRALLNRPKLQSRLRPQLVGLTPVSPHSPIPTGGIIVDSPLTRSRQQPPRGWLTASVHSPTLGHSIALALLENGHHRQGQKTWVVSPCANESTEVLIGPCCFLDTQRERLNG